MVEGQDGPRPGRTGLDPLLQAEVVVPPDDHELLDLHSTGECGEEGAGCLGRRSGEPRGVVLAHAGRDARLEGVTVQDQVPGGSPAQVGDGPGDPVVCPGV